MIFTLTEETPSKKNSRINTRSGRSFPNKRYMLWHNKTLNELQSYVLQGIIKPIEEDKQICLTLTFYHGDLKRRDSDNQCSSVLDTLIDAKIIPDDNWKVIPQKHIYDIYDKGNPHCVVEIKEI